jgi:hypothetical protein
MPRLRRHWQLGFKLRLPDLGLDRLGIYGLWLCLRSRHWWPLQMPSLELLSWVQAQNIRWAKSPKNPANPKREPEFA